MTADDLLKLVYAKFYRNKEVLSDAPELTQTPDDAQFDVQKAHTELSGVISYLMGVPDIQKEPFERAVQILQEHYNSQPEWQALLIEYFEYTTRKEEESLKAQQESLVKEIQEFTKKLLIAG